MIDNERKIERIEIRMDTDAVQRIDSWRAKENGLPSRSEAIRLLTERGLESSEGRSLCLSKAEKLMTSLLLEILRNQLSPKKSADLGQLESLDLRTIKILQEALFSGNIWALEWEMQRPLEAEDYNSRSTELKEVQDILTMWSFIESSYKNLDDAEKDEVKAAVGGEPDFLGFSANDESVHFSIACFLIEEVGQFQEFKGRDLNSHVRLLPAYKVMSKIFQSMNSQRLSSSQIIRLILKK